MRELTINLHLSCIQTKLLRIAKRTGDDELRRLALDAAFLLDYLKEKPPNGYAD